MTMIAPDPPKPKRRWFQSRLTRTLLVLLVVGGVVLGWVKFRMNRAAENWARVAAVEKAAAAITELGVVDWDGPCGWCIGKYTETSRDVVR